MAIIVGQRITNITNANTVSVANTYFTVHVFSTVGVTTFTTQGSGSVDVFLVGGGGSIGAGGGPAGGGGGSVLFYKNIPLIENIPYTIDVGVGAASTVGGATTFRYNGGQIVAPGGAQGGNPATKNNPVGSGGGGNGGGSGGIGANIIGYGFPGGGSSSPSFNGGAGGGAGGAGTVAPGGIGGIGVSYSITGVSTYYGGGGSGIPGNIDPTSFPTMFGLGGSASPGLPGIGNPGCIIVRYQS